jgi:hypothetical protein
MVVAGDGRAARHWKRGEAGQESVQARLDYEQGVVPVEGGRPRCAEGFHLQSSSSCKAGEEGDVGWAGGFQQLVSGAGDGVDGGADRAAADAVVRPHFTGRAQHCAQLRPHAGGRPRCATMLEPLKDRARASRHGFASGFGVRPRVGLTAKAAPAPNRVLIRARGPEIESIDDCACCCSQVVGTRSSTGGWRGWWVAPRCCPPQR